MIELTDIYKALQYMRTNGFWHCDLFIKSDVLKQVMNNEALRYAERWDKQVEPWEKILGPIESEYHKWMMSGQSVGSIYGCPVYDMPAHTDNSADAVLAASNKGYYVIVGKQDELGIFQGWLVP